MAFNTDNIGKNCYINVSEDENIEDSLYGTIIGYYKDEDNNEEYYFVSINGNVKKIYDDNLINVIDDGGGGSSTDSNAVHYTADSNKTDEEKAQARTNIGALGQNDLGTVLTFKGSKDTYADLLLVQDQEVGDVWFVDGEMAFFVWIEDEANPNGFWDEFGQPIDLSAYQEKPTINTVSGASVTVTPASNNVYNCGTLTSLTVTSPAVTGEYSIIFTSGSTATSTTIPSTILGLESFAAEANTLYEINVLDNRSVVGNWAVS